MPKQLSLYCVELWPAAVPTINFLSGGQSSEEATANLNAMNLNINPWNVSYSYARALQDNAMKIWRGEQKNIAAAQKAFYQRAKLNSLAAIGNIKLFSKRICQWHK